MANEVKKANVVFQTGSQQRSEFGNRFRTAVELIRNGRIGTVQDDSRRRRRPARPCDLPDPGRTADGTDWDIWIGPAPERGVQRSPLPERASTTTSRPGATTASTPTADWPTWVPTTSTSPSGPCDMDESGPTTLTVPANPKRGAGLRYGYANGVVMIHNEFEKDPKTGKDLKADCVFEGTDGTIFVGREELRATKDAIIKDPFTAKDKRVYPSKNHRQNWLDCIKAKKDCICTAETGHRTATICLLGTIAYRVGRNLTWDPVKERFVNDAEADKLLSREPRAKWKNV